MATPDPTPTDLARLIGRRAELLASARTGRDERELAQVTREVLRDAFVARPPAVRIVDPVADRDLLVRLLESEPVHPVPADGRTAALADRTATDRRVLVLEHPALPGRPFHVVWAALCTTIPLSMASVVGPGRTHVDPSAADTAVFWSIWGADPGLAGMRAGVLLLEGAIEALRSELPALHTIVTLSPVPGFRDWHDERRDAASLHHRSLVRSCARYLTMLGPDGRPLDPVARFHLGNGARLWRLNPQADTSERGANRSYGIMANYRYEPEDRPANRASLASGVVPTSAAMDALLR